MYKFFFLTLALFLLQACSDSKTDSTLYHIKEINLLYKIDTTNFRFTDVEYVQNFAQNYRPLDEFDDEEEDYCFQDSFKLHFIVKPKENFDFFGYVSLKAMTFSGVCDIVEFIKEIELDKTHSSHDSIEMSEEMKQLFSNISYPKEILYLDIENYGSKNHSAIAIYEYPDYYLSISLHFKEGFEENALNLLRGFER